MTNFQNKMTKRFLAIAVLCVGVGALFTARPAAAASGDCQIAYTAADAKALKTSIATGDTATELLLKKKLLNATLICAVRDTNDLIKGVSAVDVPDDELAGVQAALGEKLSAALQFYAARASSTDSLSLRGIQDVSREVKDKRAKTFGPDAQRALAFVLWGGNQKLFKIAETRLDQIGKTLVALKLDENSDIASIFADATTSLADARALHAGVRDAFVAGDTTDDISNTIRRSLEGLSHVYADFLSIRDEANKILPQQ